MREQRRGICEESDVIIAVMGMDATLEGEQGDTGNEYGCGDKPDLRLPGIQHDILRIAKEYQKPVILVVLCGSATALTWEQENGVAEYIAEGYEISIGGSQPDARSCALTGRKPQLLQIY